MFLIPGKRQLAGFSRDGSMLGSTLNLGSGQGTDLPPLLVLTEDATSSSVPLEKPPRLGGLQPHVSPELSADLANRTTSPAGLPTTSDTTCPQQNSVSPSTSEWFPCPPRLGPWSLRGAFSFLTNNPTPTKPVTSQGTPDASAMVQ